MELWIRSTARTNLLKVRFLTIMEGKNFYKRDEWEFKGYTICNCTEQGNYELLGTYATKERALEVLDEIQNILHPKIIVKKSEEELGNLKLEFAIKEIESFSYDIEQLNTYVYEMPKE